MTRWHGRMGRGAGRAVRIDKREEAQERDAVSTYNAEIGRVVREHNVSPRTARHVVNAERKLSARKRELAAQRQGVTEDGGTCARCGVGIPNPDAVIIGPAGVGYCKSCGESL